MKAVLNFILILLKQCYFHILYMICNYFIPISLLLGCFYNYFHPSFHFGKRVKIRRGINFYGGGRQKGSLFIGENSFINEECFLDYSSKIIIGQQVAVGMRTIILSSSHKIGIDVRCGQTTKKTTIIQDNCWVGAGALIYPGVIIGRGAIISAGEVVRNDVPSNKLLKGGELIEIRMERVEKTSNSCK